MDAGFINKAQPLVTKSFDLAPVPSALAIVALRGGQSFFCASGPRPANCGESSATKPSTRLWAPDVLATLPKKYQAVLSLSGAASGVLALRAKVAGRRRVRAVRRSLVLVSGGASF